MEVLGLVRLTCQQGRWHYLLVILICLGPNPNLLAHRDSLFVYYAPWDADSMAARRVLDDVSFAFEDHTGLYVAAVNCWNRDRARWAMFLILPKASFVEGPFIHDVCTWKGGG